MTDSVPIYRKHKPSGQAIVTLPDGRGGRRDIYLGKHGSAASRREYLRVIGEWETLGRRLPVGPDSAPADLTVGTWDLWWIIVAKQRQGHVIGSRLLALVEQAVRQEDGRQLLIETSSLPHYEPTRHFYLKSGYHVTARIPDYYAEGDDLIIYCKRMMPPLA